MSYEKKFKVNIEVRVGVFRHSSATQLKSTKEQNTNIKELQSTLLSKNKL